MSELSEAPELAGGPLDVMICGFPGKSMCHGGMGWSTVAMIRSGGRLALVDAGNFGMRKLILEQLRERNLVPADVTDLLLTHSHYDHSVNWTLFRHARIVIGADEISWALNEPWGETPVPELYVRALDDWPSCEKITDGAEVFPGMTAHVAPGHTPGCLIFHWRTEHRDFIFTGDAAKNRAELVSGDTDMTYDAAVSRRSIEMIWEIWRRRPGTVLVPGHDLPMILENGTTRYLGSRRAGIRAWFGNDMASVTEFVLSK
ncbi:MBL fold metallo-hydrolase [Ancylobacter amanitiformis]|uniref:Glyoxylase-like metal-dependent hydrolase (Beta-lactamase superfamily II) n=1 Tax=Ancylobacter amanitiformis TaxID=217069 RepID=A0ABU0LWE5_9HYPH|nr:MBL fold metallo-hydrolase [Ancylobacter amanitiformis]MDQ0512925.1 glyoxylase-like metal-dependent hydrolase (beta-lactamase superfamily II) [Ancylobacter amanitiformis]